MPRESTARSKKQVRSKQEKKTTDRIMEYAAIPECQDRAYAEKEYTTSREEKMWEPEEGVEGWFPGYSLAARTVITLKQEHAGVPNIKAIEYSCSGFAEQYVTDVLHESKYQPHEAMQMILMNDMPQKVIDKWTPEDMQLFTDGIMKHGKRFSIIRRKMLPHKRVEDFAVFYYVWKRSSMAAAWRKSREIIKAEKRKMEEERLRKQSKDKPYSNLSNNIPLCNLSNDRVMTRSATAAAKLALRNSEGTDDDSKSSTSTSPSEKDEETSTTAESTDSSKEHVQETENGLPESATSEKSPMKNGQISDNCPNQGRKRKLSIPRKIVSFEEKTADVIEEIKCVPAPIIPQWKRQRRMKNTLFNNTRAFISVICNSQCK